MDFCFKEDKIRDYWARDLTGRVSGMWYLGGCLRIFWEESSNALMAFGMSMTTSRASGASA